MFTLQKQPNFKFILTTLIVMVLTLSNSAAVTVETPDIKSQITSIQRYFTSISNLSDDITSKAEYSGPEYTLQTLHSILSTQTSFYTIAKDLGKDTTYTDYYFEFFKENGVFGKAQLTNCLALVYLETQLLIMEVHPQLSSNHPNTDNFNNKLGDPVALTWYALVRERTGLISGERMIREDSYVSESLLRKILAESGYGKSLSKNDLDSLLERYYNFFNEADNENGMTKNDFRALMASYYYLERLKIGNSATYLSSSYVQFSWVYLLLLAFMLI